MDFHPVTHVLFDMDGLILNTEDLYTIGFQEIAGRYGKEFTFSLKSKIMGQQSKEFAESIVEALGLPLTAEQFAAEARVLFDELFPRCRVLPGVEKLLRHLHENNVPIGLATSSSKESYDLKTTNHQALFDLFPYKTWGSSDPDVKRGKPSPDIFLVAANKFPDSPAPDKVVYHLVSPSLLHRRPAARGAAPRSPPLVPVLSARPRGLGPARLAAEGASPRQHYLNEFIVLAMTDGTARSPLLAGEVGGSKG